MRSLRIPVVLAIVAGLLLAAASVQAKSAKHHKHHCKTGRVLKVEHVKRHRHGKTVHVRVEKCVKKPRTHKHKTVAPTTKPAVAPAPAPSTPTPATPTRTVKLHAHLDPTYTRNPTDPFQVTYSYSASATSEQTDDADGVSFDSEPAALPEGVLALYSNGSLACAINVGGTTTGGECPVTYGTLGEQTVTTIYSSGETSATETATEDVEPIATSITGSVSYEALEAPVELPESSCGEHICYEIGSLAVRGTISDPYGELVASESLVPIGASDDDACHELEYCVADAVGTTTVRATMGRTGAPNYETYIESVNGYAPAAFEEGLTFARLVGPWHRGPGTRELPPGYSQSEARLPIQFTPECEGCR